MGMSAGGSSGGSGGRRGRGGRRRGGAISEINVTPLVDVMLVLLIIFMVAAPMMTVGVPIDLPQTSANALNSDTQPITISVNANGQIHLQETEIQRPRWPTSCRQSPRQVITNASSCARIPLPPTASSPT